MHASVIYAPAWRAFTQAQRFAVDDPPRERFLQPGPEAMWTRALPAQLPRRLRLRAARAMAELVGVLGLGWGHHRQDNLTRRGRPRRREPRQCDWDSLLRPQFFACGKDTNRSATKPMAASARRISG